MQNKPIRQVAEKHSGESEKPNTLDTPRFRYLRAASERCIILLRVQSGHRGVPAGQVTHGIGRGLLPEGRGFGSVGLALFHGRRNMRLRAFS
jgi:hypothetical protein